MEMGKNVKAGARMEFFLYLYLRKKARGNQGTTVVSSHWSEIDASYGSFENFAGFSGQLQAAPP
jgi:hypothetical protein